MRICITRSERYSYSETFIRDQIAGFSRLAEVYTIHSGRLPQRREDGSLLAPYPFWILHNIVKGITGKRNNFFGNYGLKKFFRENKIDVVLANYGLSAAHLAPICRDLNIPLLAIFHGHDATDRKLLTEYHDKYQELFRYATYIIAVSRDISNGLVRLGASPEKMQIVPCGVNVNKFEPSSSTRENIFVGVGRFVAKKGPLYTIQAFHQAWKKHPDARLVLIGSKTGLFKECEELVRTLGIEQAVTFTGILSQDEIKQRMASALAFVQHSVTAPNGDTEGTPVSVLEASASGLPVISTLHGGIKEAIIHNKTGLLVPEKDVDGMANHMIKLMNDHALAASMGIAGRQHIVAHYDQEKQIAKLYDLASQALKPTQLR
jgi:glycosyltransferase involved in cell wall biosynthesis